MSIASRRTRLLLAALGIVALALPPAASASHSWGDYHWARTSNPFTLRLGDNLTNVWDPILATTSSDWSASSVLDTTIVGGRTTGRKCRPTTGRVEVCNARYGNTGWLGVARIWVSGSHITAGTVRVNDTYFDTPAYGTTAWRNLVVCQEVGHTFGLDHQDENFDNPNLGTCMDYTNDPTSNQHPNQHDYEQLEEIYAHLDATATVGASALAVDAQAASDAAANGQWGVLVAIGHGGRTATYVLELLGGERVVTFVAWA